MLLKVDRHKIDNTFKKQAKFTRSGFETRPKPDRKPDQARPDQTDPKYLNCDRWGTPNFRKVVFEISPFGLPK